MEAEGSFPYSERPATDPCPEPDEFIPQLVILFPEDPL
jgi:hypothetical protein